MRTFKSSIAANKSGCHCSLPLSCVRKSCTLRRVVIGNSSGISRAEKPISYLAAISRNSPMLGSLSPASSFQQLLFACSQSAGGNRRCKAAFKARPRKHFRVHGDIGHVNYSCVTGTDGVPVGKPFPNNTTNKLVCASLIFHSKRGALIIAKIESAKYRLR